ncbi:MAG: hypothetical protein H6733_02320 [Alphaproteobacteria bacterium]|nr:hypothetical protein [Alphaproteobacteria bacterium]
MRIINRTDRVVAYELRGGPLRMTMSECDLLPGEEETWDNPYPGAAGTVTCEVRVTVDDTLVVVDASDRAVVEVLAAAEGVQLQVTA